MSERRDFLRPLAGLAATLGAGFDRPARVSARLDLCRETAASVGRAVRDITGRA